MINLKKNLFAGLFGYTIGRFFSSLERLGEIDREQKRQELQIKINRIVEFCSETPIRLKEIFGKYLNDNEIIDIQFKVDNPKDAFKQLDRINQIKIKLESFKKETDLIINETKTLLQDVSISDIKKEDLRSMIQNLESESISLINNLLTQVYKGKLELEKYLTKSK